MPRREYKQTGPEEVLDKIRAAGLKERKSRAEGTAAEDDELSPLPVRVSKVLGIVNNPERNDNNMLFFVMYDIESNKVRRLVAKYLERQGCARIQDSVFLADLSHEKYNAIRNDLAEVQAAYDNPDSILVVPISTDYLKSMKVIGKELNLEIITGSRNTLFF